MIKQKSLIDLAKAWSSQVGKDIAFIALMKEGVSLSTAEKIIFGKYNHAPGRLVAKAIEQAMKKLPCHEK